MGEVFGSKAIDDCGHIGLQCGGKHFTFIEHGSEEKGLEYAACAAWRADDVYPLSVFTACFGIAYVGDYFAGADLHDQRGSIEDLVGNQRMLVVADDLSNAVL